MNQQLVIEIFDKYHQKRAVQWFINQFGSDPGWVNRIQDYFPRIIIRAEDNTLHPRRPNQLNSYIAAGYTLITLEPEWDEAGAVIPAALQSEFNNWRKTCNK